MKTHLFLYSNNNSCCGGARGICFSTFLLLLFCGTLAADMPELLPGTEVRIVAPKSEKTFLVYVPTDYTDKRAFPVIYYYHGYNGSATTAMFRRITKGQGFIIVGMNYATHIYHKKLYPTETAAEKLFFKEVLALLSDRLNIANDYIFMGGYSQGGYSTTVLGEQMLDQLAGRLILGAGRRDMHRYPPPAELIQGHPIFYGVGELDNPHYPRAKQAALFYTKLGADVTFEGWPDETHKLSQEWWKMEKTKMREWLIAYGPAKQVESGFKAAEVAEKEDRLGEAFVLYDQTAGILPDTESCRLAKKSATRLATHANTQLDLIKKAADKKPYAELAKRLETLRDMYSGSIFAERTEQILHELLNAKAGVLEKRAHAAETEKNYVRALQLYKLYLTYFTEAERYAEVQKHVKKLKNETGIK